MYVCIGFSFFFQAEDGIRDLTVTGVQTCALPISSLDDAHAHLLGERPAELLLGHTLLALARDRVERACRHVLDVHAREIPELPRHVGIAPPAVERELLVGIRPPGLADGSENAGGGARGFGPGSRALEERHQASGFRQLIGRGAADDAAADDDDRARHQILPSASRNALTTSPGRSDPSTAPIAATPEAPALRSSATRAGVTPPIAKTGSRTAEATRSRTARP